MPKFAFKRLIFGAVVKIFRGEAESGLKILMRFLVKFFRFFLKLSFFFFQKFSRGVKISCEGGLGSEVWPMGAERIFK